MIGQRDRSRRILFIAGDIEQFKPDDHILKRVDRVLDLGWLPEAVQGYYCTDNGRPGIDPEVAVRLMLAGYELDEALPDHSTLSRTRARWGADTFQAIFRKTVQMCMDAGLVSGETVHVDSTLILR